MPRQPKQPVALEDRFADRVLGTLDQQAPALAERLGPPPGSDRYTQRERDALWDTRDEGVTRDVLFGALQHGLSEEDVQRFGLFRMAPDLAKLVTATPLDPARAAALAKMAEYPGRYVLTVGHSSDPAEQIAYVEAEHKRAAKRQGRDEATPQTGGY